MGTKIQKYKNFTKHGQQILLTLYVMTDLFGPFLEQKVTCFIFPVSLLCSLWQFHCWNREYIVISQLFLSFTNSFGERSFHMHRSVYRTRTLAQYYINFSHISSAKSANTFFVNILFCYCLFFFRSNPAKHVDE